MIWQIPLFRGLRLASKFFLATSKTLQKCDLADFVGASMLETVRSGWLDFIEVSSLCRKAGCSADDLALTAIKEVWDNAADMATVVNTRVIDRGVAIWDNGPGMTEATMLRLFSVSRDAISSKSFRMATRGFLGNGIRVAMGAIYVSGGSLTVEARGIGLRIGVAPNGAARVDERFDADVSEGTRVTLRFGPGLPFDPNVIDAWVSWAEAGLGSAFGGSRTPPQVCDKQMLFALVRDVADNTAVLDLVRRFDITDSTFATIKQLAARMTTLDLLDDQTLLDRITSEILANPKPMRALKRMGLNASNGAYAYDEATWRHGSVNEMPVVVEAWVKGNPVKDRKTDGEVTLDRIYFNRTPGITLHDGYGFTQAASRALAMRLDGTHIYVPAEWSGLKGPCNFEIVLAITAPTLPLISDGKAVDLDPFVTPIRKVLAGALRKAYVKPFKPSPSPRRRPPRTTLRPGPKQNGSGLRRTRHARQRRRIGGAGRAKSARLRPARCTPCC